MEARRSWLWRKSPGRRRPKGEKPSRFARRLCRYFNEVTGFFR
ncbi:hypothetical protein CHY_0533 [Carboxydothermus hydrogenoformans Z-2901]|uniref:Uncharacterized protein n=1 Tax=Carboxydothermus hydrogenoformans (strain ATCC BAA-161 / DSM 6008 / Z-2901) TaxID=246194 RepID=Q3AEP3_CARHZ|nr:hypothetical protein CHY_0533 [Carboxydothermus hydrogenoformans Z-2901]